MNQINLQEATEEQLQATAYKMMKQSDTLVRQVQIIEQELARRQQPVNNTPVAAKQQEVAEAVK